MAAVLVGVLATARPAAAQTITLEAMGGSAYNVPTPLTIHQASFPDIHFTAHYATKPFGPYAPYYSWRLNLWDSHGAWEFQHVHHRLFLTNTTPEVTYFAVHFGYNYFLAGRAWRLHGFVVHTTGGLIVTNPDNVVRGLRLNTTNAGPFDVGYRLSGGGAALSVSRRAVITPHFYLLADGGLLVAHATVPVAEGSAVVPNVGFHGHLGVGFVF
jgi:hypothetical protein